MTKKKRYRRYSPEFKREALKQAAEEGITDGKHGCLHVHGLSALWDSHRTESLNTGSCVTVCMRLLAPNIAAGPSKPWPSPWT